MSEIGFFLLVAIVVATLATVISVWRSWRRWSSLPHRIPLFETLLVVQVVILIVDLVVIGLIIPSLVEGRLRPGPPGVVLGMAIILFSGLPYYIDRQLRKVERGES